MVHFRDKVKANEKITLHALEDLVMKKYSCIVTPNQCRRAKDYALSEGECSLHDHYGMLWFYAKAILDSNEGSTVKVGVTVNPDEKTYFDRFYKPNSREILTAVGRDGNNQIYHMAWAIVNVKNKENWCWFLSLIRKDFEFPDGSGLTLISDQHKHTKDQQRFWHVISAGNSKFDVRKGYDAFTVDEAANTCSCRMWQISDLPCVYAIACIFELNKLVEPYVPSYFNIEMFGLAYNQFKKPVEGITFWPDCSNLSRILGPIPKKMPGRPKKSVLAENENEVHDDDTPRHNWNKNKKGRKSASSYFVKMRGGKSSRGGLLPA
ncbi:pentatricopeptide repeat-containing protein [Tanacetum coccineum]